MLCRENYWWAPMSYKFVIVNKSAPWMQRLSHLREGLATVTGNGAYLVLTVHLFTSWKMKPYLPLVVLWLDPNTVDCFKPRLQNNQSINRIHSRVTCVYLFEAFEFEQIYVNPNLFHSKEAKPCWWAVFTVKFWWLKLWHWSLFNGHSTRVRNLLCS